MNFTPVGQLISQEAIPQVLGIDELEAADYFSDNERFVVWCQNEENYVRNSVTRNWSIAIVQQAFLVPDFVRHLSSVNHYVRSSNVKLFFVLNYCWNFPLRPILTITGSPRIGMLKFPLNSFLFSLYLCIQANLLVSLLGY